jgi:hypothetical protein
MTRRCTPVARVAHFTGDTGYYGALSSLLPVQCTRYPINHQFARHPAPCLGLSASPVFDACASFTGDTGYYGVSPNVRGRDGNGCNGYRAGKCPVIPRIPRKFIQISGSFLALSHAVNAHRVLSLGSGRRAYATPRQTSPKMTRYCAPSAGDDLTASRGCLDESKPSTPCALRIREGGAGSP